MDIPRDPPLVLHMPTSWQPASPPVLYPHAVAEVRLPGFELRAVSKLTNLELLEHLNQQR